MNPTVKVSADNATEVNKVVACLEKNYFIVHTSRLKPNNEDKGVHCYVTLIPKADSIDSKPMGVSFQ
jgi:hypothetical protein